MSWISWTVCTICPGGGRGHPGDGSWRFGTVTRTIRTDTDGIVRLRLSAHIGIEK